MNDIAKAQEQQLPTVKAETTAVISMIERAAADKDVGIDKLEKMIELQERVLDRNARMEYDAALAQMQSELPEVEKVAQGHNSKYAKFEHILAAIKPALMGHGFSITHRVKSEGGLVHITAILSHRSGHREETTLALPPDTGGSKNAVQAIASSTEYGRRYTMNSLLGIATKDADVDGGAPVPVETITDEQVAELTTAIEAAGIDPGDFLAQARVNSYNEITRSRFGAAMNWIKKQGAAK